MEGDLEITDIELNELKRELRTKVDQLVDRISHVYKILGWEWHSVGVPSKSDIRDTVHRLIDELSPGEQATFISSGGIRVEYWGYTGKNEEDVHWEGKISMQVDEFATISREDINLDNEKGVSS